MVRYCTILIYFHFIKILMINLERKLISISELKRSFSKKFPNSEIANILLNEPSEISVEELIGAVGVWLNILDMESVNNLGFQIKRR